MTKNELITGIKGAIFDLDGTLVDSLDIWGEIDVDFFKDNNLGEVPSDYQIAISHMSFLEMAFYTQKRYNLKQSGEEIARIWTQMAEYGYAHKIKAKKGAEEILSFLKSQNISISLATTNKAVLYVPCLKNNGLYSYFDHIMNVNDINSSKSEPKIYLELAKLMNTRPEETLVFEDILKALKVAKKAAFRTVAVYDSHSDKDREEILKTSDMALDDFTSLF
ncbi:MAG: HAD family phosphatase [Bacilli bacterium]